MRQLWREGARVNKFNARRVTFDGITFDSQGEFNRYLDLRMLERAGEISGLECHPKFELQPAFVDRSGEKHRTIHYEADFRYWPREGPVVIEECKGYWTPAARLKLKLFLYRYQDDDMEYRIVKL